MKRIEKIEVTKGYGQYFYTGQIEDQGDGWVKIITTRGETLVFRKEQILQRQELKGDEMNGKDTKDAKSR